MRTAQQQTTRAGPQPQAQAPAQAPAQQVPAQDTQYEELARRVDQAVQRLTALDDGPAKQAAEEVKAAVEAIHRAGLRTIIRRMLHDERHRELLFELVDEPVVHLLLSLHGLVRPGVLGEAQRVLDRVRPALRSHGAAAELVMIDDGVAYVRLSGSADDTLAVPPAVPSVVRRTVEDALVSGVAAITAVEVVTEEPPGGTLGAGDLGGALLGWRDEGWTAACAVREAPDGEITLIELESGGGGEVEVIVVRVEGQLTAYRNACAHQGLPLEAAILDTETKTLTCPWHGYCFDALSGRCLSAPGAQLERLPLRVDQGQIWVRVQP